ncbi:MAG: hypothetical protein IPH48_17000 [bacterium]|nr:hypothetical protein [bacterium]
MLFGTGGIDAIAAQNDPGRVPCLVLFAHDGDNARAAATATTTRTNQFAHAAAGATGLRP